MFIIFGWNHCTNNDYGPTILTRCPRCNNESHWYLLHRRKWLTLFFIPVLPYQSKHLLLCKVCSSGIELRGEQIERALRLNQLTRSFLDKKISERDYARQTSHIKLLEE
jgi:hypothetical protein